MGLAKETLDTKRMIHQRKKNNELDLVKIKDLLFERPFSKVIILRNSLFYLGFYFFS